MKRKNINRNPQKIDKHTWFYDGENYLDLIHEVYDKDNNYIQTDNIRISIKKLSNFIANMQ